MFIKINNLIVNESQIQWVDCSSLERSCHIIIHLRNHDKETLTGQPAIDLVMQLCPQMLEGKRMKFIKHQWALHNTIGHPLLQLCSWLGMAKLGFYIHDNTVPRPRR